LLPFGLVKASFLYVLLATGGFFLNFPSIGQVILALDANETAGERPYEMVWANRVEPAPPTVRFDMLEGWTARVENGARSELQVTRAQNLWNRPVSRLRYRGEGNREPGPRVVLTPPRAIELPDKADSVDMWVHGNRWDWENPPGTPAVRIHLHLRDAGGAEYDLHVDNVRWQEWWLMHRKLPAKLRFPARLENIEVSGGWQTEWREIFLDSIRFYTEDPQPLRFAARPRRNLELFAGQSAGANTGPGRLPFPTREETILPMHFSGRYRNRILERGANQYAFIYEGGDSRVEYTLDAALGLGGIRVRLGDGPAFQLMDGGRVRMGDNPAAPTLVRAHRRARVVEVEYSDGTSLALRIWQKSLVVDVINRTTAATEVSFGQVAGVTEPRTIGVPFLTYGGGPRPCVLLARAGGRHFFGGIWLDWYRSNGSEAFAAESVTDHTARINGGVRYHPRTDGRRNPLFERLFLTVSPVFEEVLPTVPNPTGLHAREATDRLWQETWGPDDYEKQMKRGRMLRAYGIEKLIQCNHEIAWRDGGESFTLRTRAAPKKGGDEAMRRYVAHQRGLDWLAGLYSNYTDFAPVNEFWTPDGVQRLPDGNWRSAWPRCWAEKPLKAVEFDALLAPEIKRKYNPNSAYTDVHTAVAPWAYNDYDARVPGAGTFAQTFYAYGELLRNDSRVYGGPIFSEGYFHWLYAGLADGNYALMYDGRPLAKEPLLPVFDLYQIHPRECDIGMAWTAHFCDGIPDWRKPENLDRAIDRFLLNTLAYGHIGWLVEEDHGMARACRSYYMLQQVQARYGLKAPARVAYWDGANLVSVSEALIRDLPRTRRQLFVEYPGGLRLWLNDHDSESWRVASAMFRERPGRPEKAVPNDLDLPPTGWAASTRDGELVSFSATVGSHRADFLRSKAYIYLDGRGHWFDSPEAGADGALAIRSAGGNRLQVIRISGSAAFLIRRPYGVQGECVDCQAYDIEGKLLGAPRHQNEPGATRIQPIDKAVRYEMEFQKPGGLSDKVGHNIRTRDDRRGTGV
jgi:hypothetical protein